LFRNAIPIASLIGGLILAALIPFHFYVRPTVIPDSLIPAVTSLEREVQKMQELFAAPTPQLQIEFHSRDDVPAAKEIISTLKDHKTELPVTVLKQAALLAIAVEDYADASEFISIGLNLSPQDEELFVAQGLVEYGQSQYISALRAFQQAMPLISPTLSNLNLRAALASNVGLTQWQLGQTNGGEESLAASVALYDKQAVQQKIDLLIAQIDLYTEYGQAAKAQDILNQVSEMVNDMPSSDLNQNA
jgi:tetratricopeptide (TPR) repeat protein